MLKTPYLLFLGDAHDQLAAKVAKGICDWRPEYAIGQLRLPGCDADVGLPDLSLEEARNAGAKTMVIGVANRGGVISETWKDVMVEALESGFDLASGLHNRLQDNPHLSDAAARHGQELIDVRVPQHQYPIATGEKRTGKRCLTVGTDCSVGKMYTSLALEKEMKAREMNVDFRATGQSGILITGEGVPVDAVIADFMAGSVEWLTPDNDPDHWDLIEGQGSLFHVSFSGVTMALIHGGQPDALVVCHEPTRTHMRGIPNFGLPTLEEVRDLSLKVARVVNPDCKVIGISVNTSALNENEAKNYLANVEEQIGLPTVDPYRQGAARLVDALEEL
ncbi:MAG: N-acetyltransferase DgcN [Balneolaceae bacterium]|nr:N-acetyltransferase DgcN [Balneolaceae bacterium]